MENLNELFTPCLIIDKSKLSNNIERLCCIINKTKTKFRPHLKTAKCKEITKIFIRNFGSRAMVSTVEEIEQLKDCGIDDFLSSVAIVPSKLKRIASCLSDNCKVTVSVDHISMARELVNFCKTTGSKISAVIELDFDGHRSGVRPNAKQQIIEIGKCLSDAGLFRGIMSHAGASYSLSNDEDLIKCAKDEAEQTLQAVNILKYVSIDCELVTIGSTPTALADYHNNEINELRAGVFVFFDLVQAGVGVCEIEDIALSVLTSVISVNKEIDAIIVDAGWMALSSDRGTSSQKIDFGYGQVCYEDGKIIEDVIVSGVQQEHGIIQVRKGSKAKLPEIKPGEMLRILPNHACATAAAHDRYYVDNDKSSEIEVWHRFNGW